MGYLNQGKSKLIGMVASTPDEGRILIKKAEKVKEDIKNLQMFHTGKILGKDFVYTVSGIGKTNASHAVTTLIINYKPSLIINFGVGGAYPSSGLNVGDIAVADKEVYGDEGVLDNSGFHGTEFIGIPLLKIKGKKYFNVFPLDRKLVQTAVRSSESIQKDLSSFNAVKTGTFVTVSTCSGTEKRARELIKKYNPVCESMEGAAIAHVCCLYRIPCLEIRGVSNIVEDRDPKKWNLMLAAKNCQNVVIELLQAINNPG